MSIPLMLVNDFQQLFSGNTNGKGQSRVSESKDSEGKLKTESWVSKVPLSEDDYILHLDGRIGLGISPITTKNKCSFGVIDIDEYKGQVKTYLDIIAKFGLPLVPIYSKSGGLHLFVFLSEEANAGEVVDLLQVFRHILGLPKDTEIFPKQRTIPMDGLGNWINLPYFEAENISNKRKVISSDGSLLDLEEGLDYCKRIRRTIEEHKFFLLELPLFDAPPCLQSIYLQRDTLYRNEYLFSLARYYKAKVGDNFEFEISEANNLMARPLEVAELEKSVIRSHKRKDYSYKCGTPPLSLLCDKDECKKRKYGIGNDFISDLSYEEFIQYKTDPPWYEWTVNGQTLAFYNELDIIDQRRFRELCFRKLHVLPFRLKDSVWGNIVNNALQNVIVKDIELEDDISTGRMFMEYLTEFMTARVMADNKEQILINRVFKDKDKAAYIFRSVALIEYLYNTKNFRAYPNVEIQSKLKSLGAEPIRYYISVENRAARVWSLPVKSLETYAQGPISNILVDFLEKDKSEEKF